MTPTNQNCAQTNDAPRPNALPIIAISVDGVDKGDFFLDLRLEQLRQVDNPHNFEDIDADAFDLFSKEWAIGETRRAGGGAEPLFEYIRIDPAERELFLRSNWNRFSVKERML